MRGEERRRGQDRRGGEERIEGDEKGADGDLLYDTHVLGRAGLNANACIARKNCGIPQFGYANLLKLVASVEPH